MGGYVYLIVEWDTMELNKNNVKIGLTRGKIKNRLRKLQTGNSSKLEILSYYETQYLFQLEKMLHMHYHKNKVNGEWFHMTDEEILNFKDVCQEKESIIDLLKKENYFYK